MIRQKLEEMVWEASEGERAVRVKAKSSLFGPRIWGVRKNCEIHRGLEPKQCRRRRWSEPKIGDFSRHFVSNDLVLHCGL